MKKRIAFIINPASGTTNKQSVAQHIDQQLDNTHYATPTIAYTTHRQHATELATDFVHQGYEVVVAVGGDGTVNEVATALIGTKTALGVVSMGSGNGLARHLHIPMDFQKAIAQLNHSEVIEIDYGTVNGKPFFCTCGTGFDAYVSQKIANSKKRGMVGYLEKMLKGYLNYEPETYHLQGDGIDVRGEAFVITFANAAQWGFNAYIAPKASVQDGLMDISIISRMPVIAIPSIAFQLFTKTIHKDLLVNTLKTKEIVLFRKESGPFHRDGEAYEEGKEIHISIVENGLNVLVKKRF